MFVNEYLPGWGAMLSNPHAAMVSVTAEPTVGAAQRNNRGAEERRIEPFQRGSEWLTIRERHILGPICYKVSPKFKTQNTLEGISP